MATEEQIDKITNILRDKWRRYPTLRLSQLLVNTTQPGCVSDLFYLNDDELQKKLEEYEPSKATSL